MRTGFLAVATAALLASAPGAAQPREFGYEEIASDLAYGFCPLFLAGQFPLTGPQLAERGFGSTVVTQQHPRFGSLSMVNAKRADGEISFGGVAGKVCTVVAMGDKRVAALGKLRETMSWTGLDFKPTEHKGARIPGVTVETFKAPVEGQTLYVQLIEVGGPTPSVVAQMFAMEE